MIHWNATRIALAILAYGSCTSLDAAAQSPPPAPGSTAAPLRNDYGTPDAWLCRPGVWGLHLIDASVAMGNLLDIVGQQAKAYVFQTRDQGLVTTD